MGWKSTIDISREEAISAICNVKATFFEKAFEAMSNTQLEDMMYSLEIGDRTDYPYHGYNFNVTGKRIPGHDPYSPTIAGLRRIHLMYIDGDPKECDCCNIQKERVGTFIGLTGEVFLMCKECLEDFLTAWDKC